MPERVGALIIYVGVGTRQTKGSLIFKVCLKRFCGVCFITKNLERNSNIPVCKGIHACLNKGW